MRKIPGSDFIKALSFAGIVATSGSLFSTLSSCENSTVTVDTQPNDLVDILEYIKNNPHLDKDIIDIDIGIYIDQYFKKNHDKNHYYYHYKPKVGGQNRGGFTKNKYLLEENLKKIAELAPFKTLDNLNLYAEEDYVEEVLKKAVLSGLERNPGLALKYFDLYKDRGYAEEVLKKAVLSGLERNPGLALKYFDLYKDRGYAEEVLEKAVLSGLEANPGLALEYFGIYKDRDYAEEVLKKAAESTAEKNPEVFFERFDLYKEKSYAETLLAKVVKGLIPTNPFLVLRYFDLYKHLPCAKLILENSKIAESLYQKHPLDAKDYFSENKQYKRKVEEQFTAIDFKSMIVLDKGSLEEVKKTVKEKVEITTIITMIKKDPKGFLNYVNERHEARRRQEAADHKKRQDQYFGRSGS